MQATQAPQPEAEFQDGIDRLLILCAGLLPGAQIAERVGRALALLARTKVRSPARPRARRPGPAPAGFRWARARRSLRPRAARDIDRARLLPWQAREDRPAAPWYTRVHYIECGYSKCCSRV